MLDYLEKIWQEAENLQKLEVRQTCQTKGDADRQITGWMDGWMRINKHDGWRQKHRHELQRRWRCCNSGWWRVNDGTQSDKRSQFLPSWGLDHNAGLGGEMPRCGCPLTVGTKPGVVRGKKTALTAEPDTGTTIEKRTPRKIHPVFSYSLEKSSCLCGGGEQASRQPHVWWWAYIC